MPAAPRPRLTLSFAGLPGSERPHLSVDGMTPEGPNLSHWPGNRTPWRFKADLSTGICLRFARADAEEQSRFLQGAEVVLNDHYDTDGFLSLLAVLRPEVALRREELCLLAAATGDFQAFHSVRSFAVDRIVTNLADPERSPVAARFAGLEGAEKSLARYRWLIANAQGVLGRPERLDALYRDELDTVLAQLAECQRGRLQRQLHADLGLSIVRTPAPVHRMVLNTLAGAWRVLHIVETPDGNRYRYHDRTESWFEVVTFTPPPRRDLRPLAARLVEMEGGIAGAGAGGGGDGDRAPQWCADPPGEPVPELYFGVPAGQEYGAVTRTLESSRLPAQAVVDAFVTFFTERREQRGRRD